MGEKDKDASNDKNNKKKKEETTPTSTTLIFNIDMHCDGCTNKINRYLRRFQALKLNVVVNGVESGVGKLIVEPSKLRDKLKLTNKNNKNVDLISFSKPNKNKDNNKKPKEKEAPVTTVVLKVALHCQGCIERIRNTIFKFKGVQDVAIDKEKQTVTVKGTMDAKALVGSLTRRLKRKVEVVPPKKDNKDADKANKEKDKDKEGVAVTGKNKKKGGGNGDNGEVGGGRGDDDKEGKLKKNNIMVPPTLMMPYDGGYGYGYGYGYDYNYGTFYMGQVHAPQIFSDENPNACSVM